MKALSHLMYKKIFYEAKGFETFEEFDEDFDGHILKTVRMVLKVKLSS